MGEPKYKYCLFQELVCLNLVFTHWNNTQIDSGSDYVLKRSRTNLFEKSEEKLSSDILRMP